MLVDMLLSSFNRPRRLGKQALKRNAKSTSKATKTLIANAQLLSGEALSHSLARSQPQLPTD